MADRFVVQCTWDDVPHLSEKDKAELLAAFPEHERDVRARGIPMLGSGRVFPVDEALIKEEAIQIPKHWAQIGGLDFGIDHPFAAVKIAWDRDADCIHVTHAYRQKDAIPAIHAAAIMPWGKWVPWAWPHDGVNRDKGSGEQLASQYATHGLNMLPDRATHAEGGNGVEAGILDMLERMKTGRFKVAAHLNEWFEEFRLYHRKDGLIVKLKDDLLSATRYAVMMLRFAEAEPNQIDWSNAGAGGGWMAA